MHSVFDSSAGQQLCLTFQRSSQPLSQVCLLRYSVESGSFLICSSLGRVISPVAEEERGQGWLKLVTTLLRFVMAADFPRTA